MAECRRSVLSCARCRRRKIKCDRAIPCSQCITAKADCTGYSSRDQDPNVPRSIVQYLEAEIAKIEGELARNGHLEELNASDILVGMPAHNGIPFAEQGNPIPELNRDHAIQQLPISPELLSPVVNDPERMAIMQCGELQAMLFSILSPGPGMTDLLSRVRMNLTPSTAVATSSPREMRRKSSFTRATDEISCIMLKSMPIPILRSLIKKYMTRVFPIFPIFHAPTLWQQLENVISKLQSLPDRYQPVPPSYDFLVIYMMLTVSTTLGSAKSGQELRHMMFSGSLFEEGIQHLSGKAKIPSDLAGLQVTLLILQYATINPRLANVWVLSGAVMRVCLELGLHREPPDLTAYSRMDLDTRRRVFWSAYCIDRSVCSALQRPLTIPDQTIDTHFPSTSDDRQINSNGLDSNNTDTKLPQLRWIDFRKMQSTMTAVHFQNEPLAPGQSWEEWLQQMEQKLHAWYLDWKDDSELMEFTLSHGLMNLHRPSPRIPLPGPRSLMVAFESACQSAKSLRDHIISGFYRRSWLSAHNLLENSMVVLFCLRHGSDIISTKFTAQQVFEMTKVFTANFLTLAAQGWSEVSNYAGIYERLLGPLLESVFSNRPPSLTSFGPAQDSELTRLLYPGPAQLDKLRFGSRLFEQDELPLFDVTNLNWDEFSVSDGTGGFSVSGGGGGGGDGNLNFMSAWDIPASGDFGTPDQDMIFGIA